MPQALFTQQAGLFTSPNPFGASPPGGLALADNCIIRDTGVLESRRGFGPHSALAGGSRLTSYQATLVALAGTTLKHYTAGSWVSYTGTFNPPDAVTPMRFLQAAKCLFFTSSAGIQKLDSITGTPRTAGIPRSAAPALGAFTGSGNVWFPDSTNVAYRFVLASTDAQGNVLRGAPTAPIIVSNTTGATKCVNIFLDGIPVFMKDTSYSLLVYRSVVTSSLAAPPSDELFLALQYHITAADIAPTRNAITVNDTTAQAQLGAALYTNATQEGLGQENDQPPHALDFCNFKGTTIYANTTDRNRLLIQLLQVGTPTGMKLNDTIAITSVNGTDTYTAGTVEDIPSKTFLYDGTSIENTMRNFCRVVNLATKLVQVRADYMAQTSRQVGTVLIEDIGLGQVGWTVSFSAVVQNVVTAGTSLQRAASTVTVNMQFAHTFVVGDQVLLFSPTPDVNYPVGIKTVVTAASNSWTYTESGAAIISSNHTYTATRITTRSWLPTEPTALVSDNSRDPAGLTYSKLNQPEATPLENSDTVGDITKAILRVVPLRDSVLIFKEDGIFKLNGSSPDDFALTPYDLTTFLAAPESAAPLTDNVLFLSTRGPSYASESGGVYPIGPGGQECPIRETLLALMATTTPATQVTSFGIAYESERQYSLWLPNTGGATPAQGFVFQTSNAVWAGRWPISILHGIVDPTTNKLVLVDGTSVFMERKDFALTDYQDIGGTASITAVANSKSITMAGPGVGDLITQGANAARVLVAVGSALTLDTAGTWAVASATYARAIRCEPRYLPWAGGEQNPGAIHRFLEASFNFRSLPASWISATTATDQDPTQEAFICPGTPAKTGNVNIRYGISRNKGRGVMLSLGFIHQQALCNFELQSSALIANPVSTRTPSHRAGA